MNIDDLIERLIRIREEHGILPVAIKDPQGLKEPEWEVSEDILVLS